MKMTNCKCPFPILRLLFNVFSNIFLLANYHKENLPLLFSFCSSCFQTCSATSNLVCTDSKMSHKLDIFVISPMRN